jgi:hypothetical protein
MSSELELINDNDFSALYDAVMSRRHADINEESKTEDHDEQQLTLISVLPIVQPEPDNTMRVFQQQPETQLSIFNTNTLLTHTMITDAELMASFDVWEAAQTFHPSTTAHDHVAVPTDSLRLPVATTLLHEGVEFNSEGASASPTWTLIQLKSEDKNPEVT